MGWKVNIRRGITSRAPIQQRGHRVSRRLMKKHTKKLLAIEPPGPLRIWLTWCLMKTCEYSRRGNQKRVVPDITRITPEGIVN